MSERKTLFAEIIIPVPIHKEFTYRIPFELNQHVFAGSRVIVPFGKGKLLTGIVTKIHEKAPTEYQAKYIEYLLDEHPIIAPNQYAFWRWISSYYMAPIGDVMNAALPANLKLSSETKVVLHPDFEAQKTKSSPQEDKIISVLEIRETLDLKEIAELLEIKTIQPIIRDMINKGVVMTLEELNDKFVPKTEMYINLNPAYREEDDLQDLLSRLDGDSRAGKQVETILQLLNLGEYSPGAFKPVLRKDLLDKGVSKSTLQTLENKGIILQEKLEISRFSAANASTVPFKELSEEQRKALNEIHEGFEQSKVCILHGVTGSGKTELYVELIQEQLDMGKQVLYLLPEIALTTQLIQRLASYFGDQIGVYHSRFNQNERVEIWNHVLNNNPDRFRIIIGARSAIFLPFQDLGLIIVDEEHDSSFKQFDPSPRYHARDCAIVLGSQFKAQVLLGSATPSMESYYNAQNGKYHLINLKSRYGATLMPEILCADVKKEKKRTNAHAHFTTFLLDHIRESLNGGEQVILFQNRRGYTPLWVCEVCQTALRCVNCDVSLTYHKQSNLLKCHYCGYSTPPVGSCTKCGSNRINMIGYGTEKIEDELQVIFPDKTIKRLDLDTTRSKHAYASIIESFDAGEIDILIGTQMISKGLDFSKVNLVGITDADMLLNRAEFRAFERSFQMMTQVAGRSGRRDKRGKVVIQTKDPDHWVIQKVIAYDFEGFYAHELIERKNYFYPPYYKLIEITLKHKNEDLLNTASNEFAMQLRDVFKERVLGPEFPLVKRVQQFYLKKILIKVEKSLSDKKVKERISEMIDHFYSVPTHKTIRISIDVDPA